MAQVRSTMSLYSTPSLICVAQISQIKDVRASIYGGNRCAASGLSGIPQWRLQKGGSFRWRIRRLRIELPAMTSWGRIIGNSVAIGSAPPHGFAYGYNLADSLISEIYPSGRVVTTGYDLANRPSSLAGNGSTKYVSSLNYAAHGGPSLLTYGNGLVRTQNYS